MVWFRGLVRDERGQSLIEFALITGLIVLTAIGALGSLGEE